MVPGAHKALAFCTHRKGQHVSLMSGPVAADPCSMEDAHPGTDKLHVRPDI